MIAINIYIFIVPINLNEKAKIANNPIFIALAFTPAYGYPNANKDRSIT